MSWAPLPHPHSCIRGWDRQALAPHFKEREEVFKVTRKRAWRMSPGIHSKAEWRPHNSREGVMAAWEVSMHYSVSRGKKMCGSSCSTWVHSWKITIKGSSLVLSQSTERVQIPWAKELVALKDAQGITRVLQMTSHEISCTLNKGIVGQISPELESFQRTHKNCPEAELLHLVTSFSLCRHAVCSALKWRGIHLSSIHY